MKLLNLLLNLLHSKFQQTEEHAFSQCLKAKSVDTLTVTKNYHAIIDAHKKSGSNGKAPACLAVSVTAVHTATQASESSTDPPLFGSRFLRQPNHLVLPVAASPNLSS
jgi:hypothetical protein